MRSLFTTLLAFQLSSSMKTLTIGQRITLLVALLCVALTGVGLFAINRLMVLARSSDAIVENAVPGLAIVGRINARQAENQLRAGRLLRAPTAEARQKIKQEIASFAAANSEDFAKYQALVSSDADRRVYDALIAARTTNTAARTRFYELLESDLAAATAYAGSTVEPAYTAYSDAGTAAMLHNEQAAAELGRRIQNQVATATTMLISTTALVLVAAVVLAFLNLRAIVKVLGGVADSLEAGALQTTSAAGQVSAASQSLAEGSTEQAASLEETSASLEEISSMTKRNAENAQRAKELAGNARHAADTGVSDMSSMKTAMADIKTSSDDIAKIIKTIDEIAFQTNILALNAAVEAARAGEAGAGFAVVAEEVRNLAQRSAQAAKETAGKIEGAITKTAQGVTISNKVAISLEEIATRSREVDELVVEIATASTEQNQGIGQVTQAVAQMDQVTQKNAASAEESASAAEELNAQALAMQDNVRQLLALAGRRQQAEPAAESTLIARRPARAPHAYTPAAPTAQPKLSPHSAADTHFADFPASPHSR